MVFLIKLIVKVLKIMVSLGKFGLLDDVLSKLEGYLPTEEA